LNLFLNLMLWQLWCHYTFISSSFLILGFWGFGVAKTGEGLPALRQQLLDVVGWQGGSSEGLFMARERHVQALHEVDAHLMQAGACLQAQVPALDLLAEELRLSQNALNSITGEFSSDDLLGVIFSSFCIGK